MSKKPDDLELIAIRELGKGSKKVQDLINDKNLDIKTIESQQKVNFKEPHPAPKPDGDIRITKLHTKEMQSVEETKQEIKRIEALYADKIKPAMEEKVIETDAEHLLPALQKIDKDDLPILVEKGLNAYKERQAEKQIELEQSIELDLDDKEKFDKYPILLDFDNNEKDIDKIPSPADDYE
ncbi:hypothetical protein [Flavisericum labens]|uniref:hypothetical protein n=1 Tax=Flavisericum labens TaxID=3377112 RepID=UPI00387AA4D5